MPLTNRSLYVMGKKPGTTSLTLYARNKNLIAVVDLVVGPDVMGLKKQLHDLMPNERVGARISNDEIGRAHVCTTALMRISSAVFFLYKKTVMISRTRLTPKTAL